MTTPSQWNGQPNPEPQHPHHQQAPSALPPEQASTGYGTPPAGQPTDYGSHAQSSTPQANYGQSGYGQASAPGYEQAQNPTYGQPRQQAPQAQQPFGQANSQPPHAQPPAGNAYQYQSPGGYQQAQASAPRPGLSFSSLREELSFKTNLFGMISFTSAIGGAILGMLLNFGMSLAARSGSGGVSIYSVLGPVDGILQLLTSVAAIVFGILALRASAWRNMPAAVGSVVGATSLIPLVFYFFLNLIPYSY